MSEERKAKAAARRAARKEKSFSAIEAKPIETPATPTIEKPKDIDYSSSLRLKDATPITIPNQVTAVKPNGIAPVDTTTNELTGTAKLEAKLPQGAQQLNPTVTPDIQPRTITISDMLEGQRRKITQDKTDAAKMQKYYALADAMKALGQMGGAAVGGAIGGNVLDSAPKVAEYKESRGYLDAFEKAKQANDRLRALDEKEFNLNYSKQLRDEERAYKAEQDKITREYNEKQRELERQWNAEQNRIRMEWQAAIADKDFERQAALKRELAEGEQKFKLQYQQIANEHDTKIKNISKEIVNIQNGIAKNPVPIGFKNGKGITVPKAYYEDMQDFFIGDDWNGRKVTKDNVKEFIKHNPEKVNAYLEMYGMGFIEKAKPTVGSQSKDSKNWFDPMMVSYNRHAEPEQTATNSQSSASAETNDGQSTVISDEEFAKKWGNNSI